MANDKTQGVKAARRPRAETPRGFRDYFGAEVTARKAMLDKIAEVYHRYGFDPLETSGVETVEALGKFLPDVDRPNEGVFAWQDEDEAWMALRYDLTAPLARFAAEHWQTLPKPYRRYAFGSVWRNEKPGPGRFREFIQCDADTVGSDRPEADAEIIAMAVEGLAAAGVPDGGAIIKINTRKLLNGLLDRSGVTAGQLSACSLCVPRDEETKTPPFMSTSVFDQPTDGDAEPGACPLNHFSAPRVPM